MIRRSTRPYNQIQRPLQYSSTDSSRCVAMRWEATDKRYCINRICINTYICINGFFSIPLSISFHFLYILRVMIISRNPILNWGESLYSCFKIHVVYVFNSFKEWFTWYLIYWHFWKWRSLFMFYLIVLVKQMKLTHIKRWLISGFCSIIYCYLDLVSLIYEIALIFMRSQLLIPDECLIFITPKSFFIYNRNAIV